MDLHTVHCRVGSSEIYALCESTDDHVHCRVGSSEITSENCRPYQLVHCRVGSSEITWLGVDDA